MIEQLQNPTPAFLETVAQAISTRIFTEAIFGEQPGVKTESWDAELTPQEKTEMLSGVRSLLGDIATALSSTGDARHD
jgi:hypothetical protein